MSIFTQKQKLFKNILQCICMSVQTNIKIFSIEEYIKSFNNYRNYFHNCIFI